MTLVDVHGNPMKPSITRSAAALQGQGMTSSTFLGPNAPLYPADGVSRFPRGFEFPTGYNIAARPRSKSRMSFYAMKMLIDNYDIAQIAIRHIMNSITSYDWDLVPIEGWDGDVTREVAYVKQILRKPDGVNYFRPWLRKYLKSVLRYDAGTLYKMRLNSGRAYGLKVINGETIAPLIDGWGDRPTGDAPAYVQFVNGITWNWLLESDLIYQPMHPDDDSPYGSPPIEGVVTSANTDLRLQLFLMQTFTEGNIPAGFGIAPESWTPDQVIDFQEAFDAFMVGTPEAKTQIRFIPGGIAPSFPTLESFGTANASEAKWLMWKTAAMFSVTPDDLGFTETSNRSVGESQADVSAKVGDVPLAKHLSDILTGFIQDDLEMPLEFQFNLGGEEEDRLQTAKSDEVYIHTGVVSSSEIREMRFGKTDNVGDIVPRFIFTPAGGAMPISALLAATPAVDAESALPFAGSVAPAIPEAAKPATTTAVGGGAAEAAVAPVQKAIEAGHVITSSGVIVSSEPITKAETVGVTSATGYTGNPLKSGAETGEDEDPAGEEMAKFRKFAKSRQRLGKWWDFKFTDVSPEIAAQLNAAGRDAVQKGALLQQAVEDNGLGILADIPDPEDDALPFESPLAKSWRDSAPKAPQHEFDLKITDHYSPLIRAALLDLLDQVPVEKITAGLGNLTKASLDDLDAETIANTVRDRIAALGQMDTASLEAVIRQVIVDGYLAGGHSGGIQLGGHSVSIAGVTGQAIVNTDWTAWTPGDTAAAMKTADGGLAKLLDQAGITVKGVTQTTLDRIGNNIATGLDQGDSSDTIARTLRDLVDGDTSRADIIAHTETARAMTAAAFDAYTANAVEQWELLLSDGACPECEDIASNNPHPISDTDDAPPVHPACRCSSTPVIPDGGIQGATDAQAAEGE